MRIFPQLDADSHAGTEKISAIMPSHGGNTTRRARFIWLRRKYRKLEQKWYVHGWRWRHGGTGVYHFRLVRVRQLQIGAIVPLRIEPYKNFVSGLDPWTLPVPPFILDAQGYASPPSVTIPGAGYVAMRADGKHQRKPLVGFQKKPVKRRKSPPRNAFWSAFNRQVAGCNWVFHFNGLYPDTDVLGRHPNFTDFANGAAPSNDPWPIPSGFQ